MPGRSRRGTATASTSTRSRSRRAWPTSRRARSSGMPVSTSLSASSLNESAGARTPLASLVTGALVILTLVALAPLFSDLPKAVLGAIIIDAVVFGMIDIPELRRLRRVKPLRLLGGGRRDRRRALRRACWPASSSASRSRSSGSSTSRPRRRMPLLGREPGTHVFRDAGEHPGDETFPGFAMVRLDGGLFFATAEALDERIRALVARRRPAAARRAPRHGGRGLRRFPGRGDARGDPRLHRGRGRPAEPRAREARRRRGCSRATASSSASARTASTGASRSRSRQSSPRTSAATEGRGRTGRRSAGGAGRGR